MNIPGNPMRKGGDMRIFAAFVTILAAAAAAGSSHAYTLDVYQPATSGVDATSFSYGLDPYAGTIDISTTWTSSAPSFLTIDDSDMYSWQVTLNFTNASGSNWTSIAFELLDPVRVVNGVIEENDAIYDAAVQADFIPDGYSSSNDHDGLSFAQGSSWVVRSSDVFGGIVADELNTRDFLDYIDGVSVAGTTGQIKFGLRDFNANTPFLLAMRPNEVSVDPGPSAVPVPPTVLLFGAGLIGLAGARRGRKK